MEREYKRSRKYKKKDNTADKTFMKTIRRSIASMILCTFCLISSTWAWFVASAESQVSVIRLGEATVSVAPAMMSYSRKNKTIKQGENGKFKMPAGDYIISIEPLTGTAAMYCVIDVELDRDIQERAELEVELYNEDMEDFGEEWLPIFASDSNAILLLEEGEELEEYQAYLDEKDGFKYDVLPLEVTKDGLYRVDWEPETDRTIALHLNDDAYVTIEVFWLTDDADEDDYPELEEMNSYQYIVIYPKHERTPADASKATTAAESGSAAVTESSGAVEGTAESTSGAAEGTAESISGAAEGTTAENGNILSSESSSAAGAELGTTEPAANTQGTSSENGNAEGNDGSTESSTETDTTGQTEPSITEAETELTENSGSPSADDTKDEQNNPDENSDEHSDEASDADSQDNDDDTDASGSEDDKIPADMSTEEIEQLAV